MPDNDSVPTAFACRDWRPAVEALATTGWWRLPQALDAAGWQALRAEAQALHGQAAFAPARIGRAAGAQRETAVRGDELCWLTPEMPAGRCYLAWMEALRTALNRELFLGLDEFEAQYAHYPAGAFYRTHIDRHRDSSARVISAVLYLNEDWPEAAGGELVMYDAGGGELFRQAPHGGTLLLFRSAGMPHEVLPATRARWSIAGWFRTRA
ncbi:MAG: 2OG-Fe(II) oxygenase [Moraxellaceae bacterium]|jgi:SM-20-related protein|nr:2OG-Fe(II) oxygenase [Moraxellaceae bacterium]